MMDWQTMDTAPKDGTPILVFAHDGCVQFELLTPLWICQWRDGQWVEAGGEHYTSCQPVLWAPLGPLMPDPAIIPPYDPTASPWHMPPR